MLLSKIYKIHAFFAFFMKKTPKFLLPETAKEYRVQRTQLLADSWSKRCAYKAQLRSHRRKWHRCGSAAEKEIERRKIKSLEEQVADLRCIEDAEDGILIAELRQKERVLLLSRGTTIRVQEHPSTNQWYRKERRIVKYNGQFFLAVLEYSTRTRRVSDRPGDDLRVPAEGWYPPKIKFVTNELRQFTEDELRAIAEA